MSTNEYRKIICIAYCERRLGGGERCKSCSLNPELTNNFILAKDVQTLIEVGVQTDGIELLSRYSEEVLAETEMLFKRR